MKGDKYWVFHTHMGWSDSVIQLWFGVGLGVGLLRYNYTMIMIVITYFLKLHIGLTHKIHQPLKFKHNL